MPSYTLHFSGLPEGLSGLYVDARLPTPDSTISSTTLSWDASEFVYTATLTLTEAVQEFTIRNGSGGPIVATRITRLGSTTTHFVSAEPMPEDSSSSLASILGSLTSLVGGATTVNVVSPVSVTGDITIIKGSTYLSRNGTEISLPITDAFETIYDKLTNAAVVESIIFGAGTGSDANTVTGTVDVDEITASDGVTSLPIEITSSTAAKADQTLTYHIKLIAPTTGDESVLATGCLRVLAERAAV